MQKDVISGSVYDAAVFATDTKMLSGRAPKLGQQVSFGDGRKFVFCMTTEVLAAGNLVGTATALATPIDDKCTAAAIGATEVTISLSGIQLYGATAGVVAKDALAGGYLVINDSTGAGYQYRIKSNTASTAGTASTTVTLYDGLVVAISATTDIFLIGPRYMVSAGTATLPPVGVAMVATTGAAAATPAYFWVQTAGIAAVTCTTGTSIAIGKTVAADASAGVKIAGAVTDILVGVSLGTDTAGSGVTIPVQLTIGG